VAVKPNPYNPQTKIIFLFGLRAIGTLGAAQFYASPEHKLDREQVEKAFSTKGGEFERLLKISHPPTRDKISNVELAKLDDGESPNAPRLKPVHPEADALARIYDSLKAYPVGVVQSNFVYRQVFKADYSIEMRHAITFERGENDIAVLGRGYTCDVDLPDASLLEFEAKVADGIGEIVAVQASNRPRQKDFLLFPIPPIREGDSPRRFETKARWPRGGHLVVDVGTIDEIEIEIPSHARSPLDKLTAEVSFELDGEFRVWLKDNVQDAPDPAATYGRGRPFSFQFLNVASGTSVVIYVTRVS
jgi:hypothetical protein